MGLTFANYVIKPFFPDCDIPDDAVRLLAAAAICKSIFFRFILNKDLNFNNMFFKVF